MKPLQHYFILTFLLISQVSFAQQVSKGQISYQGEDKLKLIGEWEFYWDTLFVSNPLNTSPAYINNPGKWNHQGYPIEGKACYRLIINADKTYNHLGAFVPETHGASELYLNGKLISNSGIVDVDPEKCSPQWVPEFIYFHLDSGTNVLVWQMANYDHSKGGVNKSIIIGDFTTMLNERESQISATTFLIGSLIVISLFFFGLHLYWNKNQSTLFLGLLLLFCGIRISVYDLHLLNKALDEVPWLIFVRVEYWSTYLSVMFLSIFIRSLYPDEFNAKVAKIINAYFIVALMIITITPISFFSSIHSANLGVFIVVLIYNLYVMTRAYMNKHISGLLIFSLIVTVFFSPILASAIYLDLIPYIPFVEVISSLGVALTLSFVMAVRFAEQFQQAESLQLKTQEQNKIITNALDEKELLLAEIHHRVKNNLQTINSLLLLQSKTISDPNALKVIQESQYRIQTMALVHQKLYQTKNNDLGVNVQAYFQDLTHTIRESIEIKHSVTITQDIESIVLDLESIIHIGLIVNELVVNCMKYAFDEHSEKPTIVIQLKKSNEQLVLVVQDNGHGFDQERISSTSDSFGLKLVSSLSRKLKTKPEITSNEQGTTVSFHIKKFTVID